MPFTFSSSLSFVASSHSKPVAHSSMPAVFDSDLPAIPLVSDRSIVHVTSCTCALRSLAGREHLLPPCTAEVARWCTACARSAALPRSRKRRRPCAPLHPCAEPALTRCARAAQSTGVYQRLCTARCRCQRRPPAHARCTLCTRASSNPRSHLVCSRSTSTTLLKANHSGIGSPPRSIFRNFVPLSFFSVRPFSLATSAVT